MNLRAVPILLALSALLSLGVTGASAQGRGHGWGFGGGGFGHGQPHAPGGYGGFGRGFGHGSEEFGRGPYGQQGFGRGGYGRPGYGGPGYGGPGFEGPAYGGYGPGPRFTPPGYGQAGPGAGWRQEQNEVRQAVREGRHVPLGRAIDAVRRRTPGHELDADLMPGPDGRAVYRLRWASSDGRRMDYMVDAASGAIIGVEGGH